MHNHFNSRQQNEGYSANVVRSGSIFLLTLGLFKFRVTVVCKSAFLSLFPN